MQGVHRLRELAVEIPSVARVDLILELSHLLHEGVEIGIRVCHLGGDLVEALDLGEHVAKGKPHVLDDGLVLLKLRLLLQYADGEAGRETRLAVAHVLEPRHDLEERRLAHAVGTDDADLGPRIEAQGHFVQNDLASVCLARVVHLVDEFGHDRPLLILPGE